MYRLIIESKLFCRVFEINLLSWVLIGLPFTIPIFELVQKSFMIA